MIPSPMKVPGNPSKVRRPGRELRWIRWLRRTTDEPPSAWLRLGIGDDAAIWTPSGRKGIVLTVDVQVSDVHFKADWFSLREVGRRAVSASVSDLAAMAARPVCLLVSMILPGEFEEKSFKALYRGIRDGARRYGATIVGGNLSSGPLSLTITALGEGKARDLVTRSGARSGDAIWVTGSPGLARIGLELLEGGGTNVPSRLRGLARSAISAFKDPRARLAEARHIKDSWRPTSMIDLSDGLSTDLLHVLEETERHRGKKLGAEIDEDSLAAAPAVRELARHLGKDPADIVLSGGDDYELCFTARGQEKGGSVEGRERASRFRRRFGIPVRPIGRIVERPGLWLVTARGTRRRVQPRGWEHF
jgi:thiamine-monophosphate kinase